MIFFIRKILKLLKFRFHKYVIRPLNQIHRYDFPSENNGWLKNGNGAVWGNAEVGTMFDPYVFGTDGEFNMLVSARKTLSLMLLESSDGVVWLKPKIILNGRPGMWDENVSRGCLLHINERYYLWYSGQYNGVSCVGLALSDDGKIFKRVAINPILKSDLKFEGVSVMNPCVLWDEHEKVFKMWYSAGETYEPDVIGYAVSEDGVVWKKREKPVLEKNKCHKWECYKVGGCNVVKNADGSYDMYYIGYQNVDVARICLAHSKDGIVWAREDENLLLSPSKNAWDSDAVYKPSVVKTKEKSYLWYNGRKGCCEYIGLAVKRSN